MALRWLRTSDSLPFLRDPRVMWDFPSGMPWSEPAELIARSQESYRTHGHGFFACERGSRVIGLCGILAQEIDGAVHKEVGYRFAFDAWGQGLATEAASACRDWAFVALAADHLVSIIRPDNAASRRVAEKNGMHLHKIAHWERIKTDMCLYRIEKDEWRRIVGPLDIE